MEKYHFDRKIVSLELMTFSLNVGGYAPEYAACSKSNSSCIYKELLIGLGYFFTPATSET